MFTPSQHNINLLIKHSDFISIESFISIDMEYSLLSKFNISSCSVSIIDPVKDVLSTVPMIETSHDIILHNIVWNTMFHVDDEICWDQFGINRRLLNIKEYIDDYSDSLFVCQLGMLQLYTYKLTIPGIKHVVHKARPYTNTSPNCYSKFKHNHKMLNFVLDNCEDDPFVLMNFLNKHSFITEDWDTLSKYVRNDDLLVIIDPSFKINNGYISNKPNLIKVNLPPLYIKMDDKDLIETIIHDKLGFIPLISYQAIKDELIVVVFTPYISTENNEYTKRMIQSFHKLA